MHAVGLRGAWVEADAPLAIASLEITGDRHRLAEQAPLVGDQHRCFVPGIQAAIGGLAHLAQHVDPAQPVGLSQPLQCRNEAHR
jgi:hypothetical protein